MRISVIIPCYNAERFVRASLASVAAQSLPPYEIIVIDDGSTDRSVDAVRSSRVEVKLLRTPRRRGSASARNAGLGAAEGDWLAFLDADDVWYPNHLERAAALVDEHGAVGYINHYDHLLVDGDEVIKKSCPYDGVVGGVGVDDFVRFFTDYGSFVGMSACLVEADRAVAVGGFDEDQIKRHDLEFWLRVVYRRRWIFDPVVSSAYRKNVPGGISANRASSALYRLTAFLKQGDRVEDRARFHALIQDLARAALAKSYEFGGADDRASAHRTAFHYLSARHKAVYGLLRRSPGLFKVLRKARLT
jgi:glycosyltransferase involved in cell wall biosynthesis